MLPISAHLHRLPLWGIVMLCGMATLLAALTWCPLPREQRLPLRAYDGARQVLFVADPARGEVRALSLRGGVAPLATVLLPRGQIALALERDGRTLWVRGEHTVYRYNAQSMKRLDARATSEATDLEFDRVHREVDSLAHADMSTELLRRSIQ